jgi:hypothetical protein
MYVRDHPVPRLDGTAPYFRNEQSPLDCFLKTVAIRLYCLHLEATHAGQCRVTVTLTSTSNLVDASSGAVKKIMRELANQAVTSYYGAAFLPYSKRREQHVIKKPHNE